VAIAERDLVVTPEERGQRMTHEEMSGLFSELRAELESLVQEEDRDQDGVMLVDPDREVMVRIPASVFRILRFVVHHMSHGDAISLAPLHMELTTQGAADLLGVSRPFVIKLLESGKIPFRKVGRHRRVLLRDALAYKENQYRESKELLSEMAREAQEMGIY
jgi:excisionase family DNA binding protein